MSVKILSCQNSSCASLGATNLIRDIEELAGGKCEVEEWGCLGKCGKGPNVELQWKGGKTKVVEGVTSFKKALGLVQEKAEIDVDSKVQKLGKLKFELRRENDASKKQNLFKQCLDMIGGETGGAKSYPQQLSELLVFRSKDTVKSQVEAALKDAQMATQLAPSWAQSHLALGIALEAAGRCSDAVAALKAAVDIGKGINVGQVKRMVTRAERKAKEQPDAPVPAPVPQQEPAKPEPPAPEKSEKPKAAAKIDSKEAKADNKEAKADGKEATADGKTPSSSSTSKKASAKKPSAKKSADKDKEAKKPSADKDAKKAASDKDGKKTTDSKKGKESKDATASSKKVEEEKVEEIALEPIQRSPLDLIEWRVEDRKQLNHNCIFLRMCSTDLTITSRDPDPGDVWHVDLIREMDHGEELKRSYTPISDYSSYKKGTLDFLIKVYPDGKMTPHLSELGVGTNILVSPPAHTLKLDDIKDMVMIAGGSAITVAIQICGSVLKSQSDAQVDLLMCNRGLEDVLYADVLEDLQTRYSSFKVVHCLSAGFPAGHVGANPKALWHSGRVSKDVIRPPKAGTKCVVSGPMGLCQAAVDIWAALGQDKETLEILDDLPSVEETPEESIAETKEELESPNPQVMVAQKPEPAPLTELPTIVEPLKLDTADKAAEGGFGNVLCSFWKPFWCTSKRADNDDVEISEVTMAT